MQKLQYHLTALFSAFFNFLLPELCPVCGKSGQVLCAKCLGGLPRPRSAHSPDIITCFDYRNELVKRLIWKIKYSGGKRLGFVLGTYAGGKLSGEPFRSLANPILVPIPLAQGRLRRRGFNQAEVFTDGMLSVAGNQFEKNSSILRRIRDTGSQTNVQNRDERIENVAGCFTVSDPRIVSGRDVILVDDVVTTGATLREARAILLHAGARRVTALVLAH